MELLQLNQEGIETAIKKLAGNRSLVKWGLNSNVVLRFN
jgi:hypothetical protein